MEVAVVGLIGVLLGAAITGGTQILLDWRRRRYDFETAKRLIEGELLQSILVVRSLNDVQEWPPLLNVDAAFPASAWEQHRVHLARSLPEATWNEVVLTYGQLQTFRTNLAIHMDGADLTNDWCITEASKNQFETMLDSLESARSGLRGKADSASGSLSSKNANPGGDSLQTS